MNDYLDMNKYRTEIGVFSIVGEDAFNAAAPDKLRYEDAVDTANKIVKEIKDDEDGKLVNSNVSPRRREALEKLAQYYADGVLDPEFVTAR